MLKVTEKSIAPSFTIIKAIAPDGSAVEVSGIPGQAVKYRGKARWLDEAKGLMDQAWEGKEAEEHPN
jgi:hypothetical protein